MLLLDLSSDSKYNVNFFGKKTKSVPKGVGTRYITKVFCCSAVKKKAHHLEFDESTPFSSAPLTPTTCCYKLHLTLLPT